VGNRAIFTKWTVCICVNRILTVRSLTNPWYFRLVQRCFTTWLIDNLPLDVGAVPLTVCLRTAPFVWPLAFLAHALLQKGCVFVPSKYLGLTEQNYNTRIIWGWWTTGRLELTSQFAPGTVVWGGWLPIAGVQFFSLSLFAHVFPQYGWTFTLSVYLGRRWQYYTQLRCISHRGQKGRTSQRVLLEYPGLELTEDCPLGAKLGRFIGAEGAAETFDSVGCGTTGAVWGGGCEGWFPTSFAANEG